MAAGLVLVMTLFVSVKTASYGAWEIKRKNIAGGGFASILALFCIALAVRYFIRYWA